MGRILPIQSEVAVCWGDIEGQLLTKGAPIPSIDGLIAATAIHHGLTIVTRNVKDFSVIAQKYSPASEYKLNDLLLNPWGSVKK
jgi:predicted nucleic acid-binding protein